MNIFFFLITVWKLGQKFSSLNPDLNRLQKIRWVLTNLQDAGAWLLCMRACVFECGRLCDMELNFFFFRAFLTDIKTVPFEPLSQTCASFLPPAGYLPLLQWPSCVCWAPCGSLVVSSLEKTQLSCLTYSQSLEAFKGLCSLSCTVCFPNRWVTILFPKEKSLFSHWC